MASRPLHLADVVADIYKQELWLELEGRAGDHGGHRGRENRGCRGQRSCQSYLLSISRGRCKISNTWTREDVYSGDTCNISVCAGHAGLTSRAGQIPRGASDSGQRDDDAQLDPAS